MKKVLNWLVNHLVLVVGIALLVGALGVAGGKMLKSQADYGAYEDKYDVNDLEVRSMYDAAPKNIEIIDKFVTFKADGSIKSNKSGRKNSLNVTPDQFTVTTSQESYINEEGYLDLTASGGKVELSLTLEEKSFVDIAFVVSSQNIYTENEEEKYGVKELISNVNFIINGQTMDDSAVDLVNSTSSSPEWHNLVMAGFALPAGDVKVTIQSINGKNALMPNIKNIAFFSSQPLTLVQKA